MNDELSSKGLVMIGMNTDEDPVKDIVAKIKKSEINWRQGMLGAEHELMKDYNVTMFPTKVLIDREGIIRSIGVSVDPAVIEKYL
jgi:hypothetical protein